MAALLGVLRTRPEFTALTQAFDKGFRGLGVRLLVSTPAYRQPKWSEPLVVMAGILLLAGG